MRSGAVLKSVAVGALVAAALTLTGCTGPNRDKVVERFSIELAASGGEPSDWVTVSESLAEDALAGKCGQDAYWSTVADLPNMRYAWAATCLMYFEADMSHAQQARAKQELLEFTARSLAG